MNTDHDSGRLAFLAALDGFMSCIDSLCDRQLMAASRCTGWTVADVVVHVHLGLQEMLLGLVSITAEEPDTDCSSYWRITLPGNDDDADQIAGMRFVGLMSGAYLRPSNAVRHLLPTAEGIRAATSRLEPAAVRFQGRVLATGDFLATWAVELAVHQLDMARELAPPEPASSALRLARLTVEDLAGVHAPRTWSDETVVLLGAGRMKPASDHWAEAPELVQQLPVLG